MSQPPPPGPRPGPEPGPPFTPGPAPAHRPAPPPAAAARAAAVIEFGPQPARASRSPLWWWRDPRLVWVPAVVGLAALFGSLVGEWQVVLEDIDVDVFDRRMEIGLVGMGGFGVAWLAGGMVLAACLGLTLRGHPLLRLFARQIGLAAAGVQAGLLVVIGQQLQEPFAYRSLGLPIDTAAVAINIGRGPYLAVVAVLALALALWLARPAGAADPRSVPPAAVPPPRVAPGPPPPGGDPGSGPGDLTVRPAEPFAHPSGEHEWR